jgi:hypothetical protein
MSEQMSVRRGLAPLVLAVLGIAVGGCTTQTVRPGEMAAVAPMLSVERFLQAVNVPDYAAMARLFGTADGPLEGDRPEIELRMDLIANILAYQDYRIVSEAMVPGREQPTTRIGVDLTIGGEVVSDVAFVVVRTREGRWMIQEIDLEAITGR